MRISNTWKGIAIWLLLLHTCQFALMGCGGSGGGDDPDPVLTSRQIAQKFANADTKNEKASAFESLFDKVRIGMGDDTILGKSARPSAEAMRRITQVLADYDHDLALTRSPMKALETVYGALHRPEHGLTFSVPVATIVAQFNAELGQVNSNPETPDSCLLRVAIFDPENPNATPTPVSTSTQLTATQGIAFSLWVLKFADGADSLDGRWVIIELLIAITIISALIIILLPIIGPPIVDWLEDLFDNHDQGSLIGKNPSRHPIMGNVYRIV